MAQALRIKWLKLTDTAWRLFISLKLTFVLLITLGLGAVLGMSFDQTLTFEEFLAKVSVDKTSLFFINFFELNDAFHSWWFSLALFFLSLNLIACSIERLPRIFFDAAAPRPYLNDRRLLGLTLKKEVHVNNQEEALSLIKAFFKKAPKLDRVIGDQRYFYREEHLIGRFGVYIVHIALLIIMYSSMYATQNGINGHVLVEEGQKTRFITARGAGGVSFTYDLGFYIGCNDFRLRTFVDNSPMEYESDLFISTKDRDQIIKKTVRVNEPLSFAGFTFYQSSFKPVISEKVVELLIDAQGKKEHHRVHLQHEILLPNKDILVPEKFYEDFAGLGQAVRLNKKSPDGQSTFFHVFRQYPDFDRDVRQDFFNVSLLETDQRYATGLSIGYVPGIGIIFSGFLLLLAGLYMCFFMTPVRYFARLDHRNDGIWVIFAAQAFRYQNQVQKQFELKTS